MMTRIAIGIVVLGSAAIAAAFLHWLMVDAIGFDGAEVLQGGLATAGLIGVAYLANVIPGGRK